MSAHDCGTEIPAGALLCFGCGLEIVAADIVVTPAGVSDVALDCEGCGRPLAAQVDICVFCGGSASPQEVPTPQRGARVILPNGAEAAVGTSLLLGRMSTVPGISSALDFDGVSRRHALLTSVDGALVVRDLGSTNGTWLDGVPVSGDLPIPVGRSRLRLGARVELDVVNEGAT